MTILEIEGYIWGKLEFYLKKSAETAILLFSEIKLNVLLSTYAPIMAGNLSY